MGACLEPELPLGPPGGTMSVVRSRLILGHAAAIVAAIVVLTSCGSGMICTTATCASGLIAYAPASIGGHQVTRAKICLDGSCRTVPASPDGHRIVLAAASVATTSLRSHSHVTVSITLESAGQTSLLTAHGLARLHRIAPNGVRCGPVCYQAGVAVHSSGILSAASS